MSSRFFAASDSESDSEHSDIDDDQLAQQMTDFHDTGASTGLTARFTFDDSDSDDEGRVVRTQKEKRFEQLQNHIKALKNHQKIRDWINIASDYDAIQKAIDNRNLAPIIKEEGVPRFYLKAIVHLHDFVAESYADTDARKKLSKTNAKSLSKLRQILTKKNKLFVKELREYRENLGPGGDGDDYHDEGRDDSDSHDDSDDDGMSEDSYFDSGSDSDSGSDDDSGLPINDATITRDYWVKKTPEKKQKKTICRLPKRTGVHTTKVVKAEVTQVKQKVEWTAELIQKKLQDVFKARGRAGFDKKQAIRDLRDMNAHTDSAQAKVAVLCALIAALNDINLNKASYLNPKRWRECLDVIMELVSVLRAAPEFRLRELDQDEVADEDLYDEKEEVDAFDEVDKMEKDDPAEGAEKKADIVDESLGFETIRGNLYAFVILLVREYRKSLQFIDYNEPAYEERRRDVTLLLDAVRKVREYYEFINNQKGRSRMCSIILEHIYQTYDEAQDAHHASNAQSEQKDPGQTTLKQFRGPSPVLEPPADEVTELCRVIFAVGDSRAKSHAVLQRATHYAIHNRYRHARDLLLMSHLGESISNADVQTQILYNRTQAFLGLAAFRCEEYMPCLKILAEIYNTRHVKEVLAQGVSNMRYGDRDLAQEAIERKRTFPNHLHISLDLLEAVHLTAGMLLEIPLLALNQGDPRPWQVAQHFRNLYDGKRGGGGYVKEPFHGPPENTRDYILAGAVALSRGKWRKCHEYLGELKMWSLTQNEERVRGQIAKLVKEAGLQTYLVCYGSQYRTLSLANLARMFEWEPRSVRRVIAKMIDEKDLHATLDAPAQTVVIHEQKPSYLQKMALLYADKLMSFVEQNEKLLESVSGRPSNKNRGDGGDRGDRNFSKRSGGDRPRNTGNNNSSGGKGNFRQRGQAQSSTTGAWKRR